MVFVEFDIPPADKFYMVGRTLQSVKKDVLNFGFRRVSAPHEISEDRARSLKLGYLDAGIRAISSGTSEAFMLGPPQSN